MKSILTFLNRAEDAETPASGKVRFWFKDNIPFWRGSDGIIRTLVNKVFGDHVNLSFFEDYTGSTSGSSWTTYSGIQFPNDVSGTFIVLCFAVCRMNTTGGDARIRLALDGNTVGRYMSEEFKDSSSSEKVPRVLLKKIDINGGEYLDLDFATERSGDTITIYESAVILWRIW